MVTFTDDSGTLICKFSEQMNTTACSEIEASLLEHVDNYTGKIVFDMSNVSYIASSFLRICISTAKIAGIERFNIINTKPEIYNIFEVSGLDDLIHIN